MRRRLVLIVLGWIMQDYLNQSLLQLLRKSGSIYRKKIDVGRKICTVEEWIAKGIRMIMS